MSSEWHLERLQQRVHAQQIRSKAQRDRTILWDICEQVDQEIWFLLSKWAISPRSGQENCAASQPADIAFRVRMLQKRGRKTMFMQRCKLFEASKRQGYTMAILQSRKHLPSTSTMCVQVKFVRFRGRCNWYMHLMISNYCCVIKDNRSWGNSEQCRRNVNWLFFLSQAACQFSWAKIQHI